jgi:hypothetical protein
MSGGRRAKVSPGRIRKFVVKMAPPCASMNSSTTLA